MSTSVTRITLPPFLPRPGRGVVAGGVPPPDRQTSQLPDIVAFIKRTLEGVAGIGIVHDYEPVVTEAAQITARLGASGGLHYWTVKRTSTVETRLTNVETQLVHEIALRGYQEVGDASVTEAPFQRLVNAVTDTFRVTHDVGGGADAEVFGPAQVEEVGHRLVGQTILVHHASLRIGAQERLTP